MQNLIIFIFFFSYNLFSEDFCLIHNILEEDKIINCKEKQLLFGYLGFESKKNILKFTFNQDLNEYVPLSYEPEILAYIRNNCYKKSLKIKTITNFNSKLDEYMNEIIVECRYKL